MSLEEASLISQIVAAIAVVASLIFVGLQLRQASINQRILINESRLRTAKDDFRTLMGPEFISVARSGSAGDPSMTDEQIERFLLLAWSNFYGWDEQLREAREGVLDDGRMQANRSFFVQLLRRGPGYRAAAQMYGSITHSPFMNKLLDEARTGQDAEPAQAWRTIIAATANGA